MARSRYSGTPVVDGSYYSFSSQKLKKYGDASSILEGLETVEHIFKAGERLDVLAAKYFNDEQYWWVIAFFNDIGFGLQIEPGQTLRIPSDLQTALDRVFK